jgi:DnaJ domain
LAIVRRGSSDPYKVLQVDPSAEQEVIEAAYRRLVRKYHPDVNSAPAAEARMKDLIDAYAVVRDPARRAEFDRRRAPLAGIRVRWPRAWRWTWTAPEPRPAPAAGRGLHEREEAGGGRPPCSRHPARASVGTCHVCGGALCGACASLVQPAGCPPCVWRRARRVQLRAIGALAGFVAAFALVLAMAVATVRAPLLAAIVAAYLVSATALGITVMAGRMWRSGWQDEPRDMDLGVTFLVWVGLIIGWVGAPVLLAKMASDVGRGRRLAAIASDALQA